MPSFADQLEEAGLCHVCALPLPRTVVSGCCSRRCSSLRKRSLEILSAEKELWSARILDAVSKRSKDSTICPGELSQQLMPDIEKPVTLLRPLIYEMAEAGKLRLSQKGKAIRWNKIRGPFRVRT